MSKQEERDVVCFPKTTEDGVHFLTIHLNKLISEISYEMRNDQNDGWVKEHYRNSLIQIRDEINKVLEI